MLSDELCHQSQMDSAVNRTFCANGTEEVSINTLIDRTLATSEYFRYGIKLDYRIMCSSVPKTELCLYLKLDLFSETAIRTNN